MSMRRGAFIFIFLGLLLSPALAGAAPEPLREAGAVEAYLNGISTLRARFVQTAGDGRQAGGTFLLKRPGRMRFEYAHPLTDFIVADGLFIYYYDGQMKQQSNVPIGESLAGFFLRPDLKLSGDIGVSGIKRDGGLLRVTLVQSEDPLAGSLTLALTEHPLRLKKWIVVDAQGLITEVELFDVESGVKLDDDAFHYYDPERKNPSYNRN
ncbi:MAG: outer membrane lipoprotein carrier protein LolA [Pseudomonadota bacterium]